MRWLCLALLFALAPMAQADTAEVVAAHARPGAVRFAESAAALNDAAQADCRAPGLQAAYQAAADGWIHIAHLRLGPSEERGRAQAIWFWPDPKNSGGRAQADLIRSQNPVVHDPQAFGRISVALRGLTGLERLIFATDAPQDDYACALIRAITTDLAGNAQALADGWSGEFARTLLSAGAAGNHTYLSPAEARQALFTQLVSGLGFVADQRLARPLGSETRAMPERAEGRLAGRSQRNVELSLLGLRDLAQALAPESAATLAALDAAIAQVRMLDHDPLLAGVADPAQRPAILALQAAVLAARATALADMAPRLGVDLGFNAADGD